MSFRIITPLNFFTSRRYINSITLPYKSAKYKNAVSKAYLNKNPQIMATRTFDGTANNLSVPTRGSVGINLLRKSPAVYADGLGTMVTRANPRIVSNTVCASASDVPSSLNLTNIIWIWGQFIDHELDLTRTNSSEPANITTPLDDEYPSFTIAFDRSKYTNGVSSPREQQNSISSFIDGTNVYGYENPRSTVLRRNDGTGKLNTVLANNGEVLPMYNTPGLDNASTGGPASSLFLCGDIRANENIFLTAMHTLFVREHNRLCDLLVATRPVMTQEEMIYQCARRIVLGMMQNITFKEFLPALLGDYAPVITQDYDAVVDPGINTEFSTVGYRLGHSFLPSTLTVGNNESTIELKDAFFNPSYIQSNGIDKLLVGACVSNCNELDVEITNAVRNFLFGAPSSGQMLDLATLNIQRARDHGIADYNTLREAYGLARVSTFAEITTNVSVQDKLATVYPTVDDIDPWVGALAEDNLPSATVGPLIKEILVDQFTRLRDGDRFWWTNDPAITNDDKQIIQNSRLSDIIKRNIAVGLRGYINSNVFYA